MNLFIKGKPIALVCLCAFLLLVAVALVCALNYNGAEEAPETSTQKITTTESEKQSTTAEAISTTKEISTTVHESTEAFPEEIKGLFTEKNLDSLIENKCQQLIVVDTEGKTAAVSYYEQTDEGWLKNSDLTASAFIGINGSASGKKEGDGCTPLGLYKINSAFYINQKPQTNLDSFRITEDSYWVDDVNSAYYNQYVDDIEKKDWSSAEHMIEYESYYRYGFVVDYNSACVPGLGSAIFFHVGYSPTAGCIAINEEMLLNYLSELDEAKNPYVLIV